MHAPTRRATALTALGVAAVLGMALAPSSGATVAPLASAVDQAFAPRLVTVDTPTRADKDRLNALGLDLTEHAGHDYVEVVLHTAADLDALTGAGFSYDVRIPDLVARERERVALDKAFAEANLRTALPSGNNGYRDLADYGTEIDELVALGPDIAKRISIGKSVEGRDLTGIEIGVGVNEPEDGRPVFLMFGNHHAREWPSAEMPMEFAHDLVKSYLAGDARVVDLLTRGRAIIVPVSNPDGFDASRTSGDLVDLRGEEFEPVTQPLDDELGQDGTTAILATPGNAYKRKNCRYVDGQTQPQGTCVAIPSPGGFGVGVDLNRNYGALWGGPGAESNPASPIYRGPAPFSEPETQAIRNIISTRQVTTLITNHTFSNLILRPVGVNPAVTGPDGNPIGFAPDECFTTADGHDNGMQALGERMAAQNGYSNQFGWELYDTTGTTEDYSYNATGGYGYTFEIGPDEFHPPFQSVVDEYLGDTAAAEGVTATNADALTTEAADECGGDQHAHDQVGGGNRAAYLEAFENAVDAGTHALVTGQAPAGATLTLERTGVFPLWDGTFVADTVATDMTTDATGAFAYHANPSTRPFVQSRKAPLLSEPLDQMTESGATPASLQTQTVDYPFEVTADRDILNASVKAAVSPSGVVLDFAEFHLRLLDPAGNEVASATEFGGVNSIAWSGPDGSGVPAGTYTLRVGNSVNPVGAHTVQAQTFDVLGDQTPRQFEQWTLSCVTAAGLVNQVGVSVERGQSVDVGDVCKAGLGVAAPLPLEPTKPGKGGSKSTKPRA